MRGITQRPPVLRKTPSLPRGPKWEQSARANSILLTGPGVPPMGFVTGTTSGLEWVEFWSLVKILAPNRDPRTVPFYGIDGLFRYQKAFDQGRSQRGGQVIDFVVFPGGKISNQIAIRIQGSYIHGGQGQQQQSEDQLRKVRIASVMRVVDIWDYDLLESTGTAGNGSKAIITTKQALGLIEAPSRIAQGTARAVLYRPPGRPT